MKVLARDSFARPHARPRASGNALEAWLLPALVFLSLTLLVLGRVKHPLVESLRTGGSEVLAPVLEITAQPALHLQGLRRQLAAYYDLMGELDKLKIENQKLKQWQWRARQLESEARSYRTLLSAVDDSGYTFRTGRVIADARSPFVRSSLVNLGRQQEIKNGYAVVNSGGLVGRVIETGERASRVLLITDLNSRIPVEVGPRRVRAILRGNNDERPVVEFAPAGVEIAAGEEVVTSGQDGLLPKGLLVGTTVRNGERVGVVPAAGLESIDYVSVLIYEAPALELANAGPPSSLAEPGAPPAKH